MREFPSWKHFSKPSRMTSLSLPLYPSASWAACFWRTQTSAGYEWISRDTSTESSRLHPTAANTTLSVKEENLQFYLPTFAAGISQDFLIMLTWASVRFFISGIGMFSTAMMRFWMLLMMFPIAIRPTQAPWRFWRKLTDHDQADALPCLSNRVVA